MRGVVSTEGGCEGSDELLHPASTIKRANN
jgi:hypothetical protein